MGNERTADENGHLEEASVVNGNELNHAATSDIDNYHGLSTAIILVYLSCFLLSIAQILTLVGSGAFGRTIAASQGNTTQGTWLIQIPTILVCSIGPPVAQAADFFGRKWLLVLPTACGFIGCMVVANSSSWAMALGGQFINALAFAVSGLLYAVASEITPRKFRGLAQSGITIGNGLGAVFCLIFGEWLVNHSAGGWRTFFYINGGVQGVAAVVFAICYSPPPRPLQRSLSLREKLSKLDWIGSALLICGITLYNMGLSWSQAPYPWSDPHVSATFAAGAASLMAFAAYEILVRRDGMFNHSLFKRDRNFALTLGAVFAEGFAFYAVNGFFVFQCSVLYETNPVILGTIFSMTFITSCFTSLIAAIIIAKYKRIREPIQAGFIFATLFFILMATAELSSGSAMWGFATINGLSFGLLLVSLVTAAQLSAPHELIAIATGLLIGTRSLGASTGLPIFNAIFNNQVSEHLVPGITKAVLAAGLPPQALVQFIPALLANHPDALLQIDGVTPQIIGIGVEALKHGYLVSFRYVWVCGSVITFAAGICSCFLINPKKDITMHVDAPLDEEVEE